MPSPPAISPRIFQAPIQSLGKEMNTSGPSSNPPPAPPETLEGSKKSNHALPAGGTARQKELYVQLLIQSASEKIGQLFPNSKNDSIPLPVFLEGLLQRSAGTAFTLKDAVHLLQLIKKPVDEKRQFLLQHGGTASAAMQAGSVQDLNRPTLNLPTDRELILGSLGSVDVFRSVE